MKKIIIWSLVILILAALGFFGFRIWDNYVEPYLIATKHSEEELRQQTDNKKIIQDVTGLELREMTEEEKEAVKRGEKTESEIMEQIIKEALQHQNLEAADAITAKYLGEIYALQSQYTGIVEGIIPQIKEYYYNLRNVEKYEKQAAITAATQKYMPQINSYESECDAKIEDILKRLEKELKDNSCDTSIVSVIKSKYSEEKDLKQAYYIKLLLGS